MTSLKWEGTRVGDNLVHFDMLHLRGKLLQYEFEERELLLAIVVTALIT